jgi:hypothetical protein
MKHHLTLKVTVSGAARLLEFTSAASLLLCGMLLRAAVPANPIIELTFPEGTNGYGGNGVITTNTGILSGYMTFYQIDTNLNSWETNAFPVFTNVVPTGTYVPAGNAFSVNMGAIGGNSTAGNGGRAIDSKPSLATIGACPKLTVCGWVNANSYPGVRSVDFAYAFESAGVSGFDLQEDLDGTILLYINGFENDPPASTLRLTPSANYAANNWIFFAATYDPTLSADQVKYYFGRPDKLAALDVAGTYVPASTLGSNVDFTGSLSVGNCSDVDGARDATGGVNHIFRGLIDEFRIYTNALTLDEVQQAQVNAVVPPTPASFIQQPLPATAPVGADAIFSCDATGSGLVTYQWRTNGVAVTGATNSTWTWSNVQLANNGTAVSVVIANPALPGGLASANATLTVIPADPKIVSFSFSANSGILTLNDGAFAGTGRRRTTGGFPLIITTNVPSGQYAPSAAYNIESLHMGPTAAHRAVDMTNNIVSTVGNLSSMKGLTICGWLNSANYTYRSTSTGRGCGIVNASLGGANGGFALAYRDNTLSGNTSGYGNSGRLALYVNEWPSFDPAASQLSSIDTIPLNTNLPPENWIFFAVTYDGTLTANNLNYYFGSATNAAAPDPVSPQTYAKGVITATGPLAIGNHNCSPGDPNTAMPGNPSGRTVGEPNGTMWRGLMDEIKIYNKVLTLPEIQAAQVSPALPPHLLWNIQTNNLVFSWEGPFQLQSRTNLDIGSWANVTTSPIVSGTIRSLAQPISGDSKYYRLLY